VSRKILLKKATRIEGNAQVNIEVDEGRVRVARFMVQDFRGFERFLKGRQVEFVPHLVSRICGLCSASHQVASLKAIEDAMSINVHDSVHKLRDIIVLAEWISSHSLSYFFLTMPDFIGASGGLFELMKTQPDLAREALALRKAGQDIIKILGKRSIHPVSLGIGGFLMPVHDEDLEEVHSLASEVKSISARLIRQVGSTIISNDSIDFPPEQNLNFLTYGGPVGLDEFQVYDKQGNIKMRFSREEFEQNVSEMRAEWSLAKFPFLNSLGFPEGIMLVGPLSRSYLDNGFMSDADIKDLPLTGLLINSNALTLESYDVCRLIEIFWAAKRILSHLETIDVNRLTCDSDTKVSGKGIGVIEAPRGVLVHSYLINRGCIERLRLLVATQFNNAYINLIIKDIAEKNLSDSKLTEKGERLISRSIRIFDPCLSCATH